MRMKRNNGRSMALAAVLAIVVSISCWSLVERQELRPATGSPQLVSVQQLPDYGEICQWPDVDPNLAATQKENLFAALQQRPVYAASQNGGQTGDITRPPTRTIRDTDPIYSSVAVDTRFDEVILQDNNMWSIRVFNRMDNTPPGVPFTEPKRVIQGPETDIQFNNGLYIDPKNGDIYSVETDTGDKVVVFPRDAKGDIKPGRILHTPHRGFALRAPPETTSRCAACKGRARAYRTCMVSLLIRRTNCCSSPIGAMSVTTGLPVRADSKTLRFRSTRSARTVTRLRCA